MYTIFLGMYVLTNLVESMMVGNSRCLMFIDNSRILKFYKSQWWLLELRDVHRISLVMQYTQFDHTYQKIGRIVTQLMWINKNMILA
jgi:hypothetical protein